MGSFLDKPETTHHTLPETGDAEEGNGLRAAMSCMQGWRVEMEDDHSLNVSLSAFGRPEYSFFAVFDGHGGKLVAKKAADQLLTHIANSTSWSKDHGNLDNLKNAIKEGFYAMDAALRQSPEQESGEDHSGSTAVCALLTPTHVIFGNVGDSRGILVENEGGKPKLRVATIDHKPNNPVELQRIQDSGNHVTMKRVNGDLAVSRALGDFAYKQFMVGESSELMPPEKQAVTCDPEFYVETRKEADAFLILACDGVWDVMENQTVAEKMFEWTAAGASNPRILPGNSLTRASN